MLLTLTPPSETKLKLKNPHAHSPPPHPDSALPLSQTSLASIASLHLPQRGDEMSHQHRGLPPPAGMSLPDPVRGHSTLQSSYNPIQSLPAAPSQWQGAEESMQSWLYAKAEEDKKRQEEEKTKQEELRLSQRRIEADMLRDSISGGVPPHLVPIIFAGLGGPALASAGLELAQHHLASVVQAAQHHQYYAPNQPPPPPPQIQQGSQTAPGQPAPTLHSQSSSSIYPSPAYHQSPQSKNVYGVGGGPSFSQPTSAPRLARLTTSEPQIHRTQDAQDSSPSIYFHHWQPPSQQSAGSTKESAKESSAKTSPPSGTAPSHLSESIVGTSSPRKRKAQGEHKPAPPPSGGPPGSAASPSFSVASTVSSKGRKPGPHGRHESGESSRGYDPIRSSRQPERRESSSRGTDSASKPSSSRQQSPQPALTQPQ